MFRLLPILLLQTHLTFFLQANKKTSYCVLKRHKVSDNFHLDELAFFSTDLNTML